MEKTKAILRTSLLGEQTAENDKLLLTNFVETTEYRSVLESKDATVVVGRRGTGKSAMFAKLSNLWGAEKNNRVVKIAPEDLQLIPFRGFFSIFSGEYSHVRAAARIVWKYGLLVESLVQISKAYKVKEALSQHSEVSLQIKTWQPENEDFLPKLCGALSKLTLKKQEPETILGELYTALQIPILEKSLSELLELSKSSIYILVDRLDEGYKNDEIGAAIISGVITAVAEINKRFEKIRPILFLRDNIIRTVEKYDPDYSRNIEGELIRVHWDTRQLLNFVARRLNQVFSLQTENSQKVWDRCTANQGDGKELQGIEGFKRCLQFTLYRPRDLLSLLNKAFYLASCEDRNTIVFSDIEKTAQGISSTRLDDLKKEYATIIPSIQLALDTFADESPEMTYGEALENLSNVFSLNPEATDSTAFLDATILKPEGMFRALYSVGFVGAFDIATNTFLYYHDGRSPDRELRIEDKILIHPCYWIALNLSKNVLAAEEAKNINDEYEIKDITNAESREFRGKKLGALISEIGKIPTGKEGATLFEDWLQTAIQTVFAGHLSNVALKVNGDAVQRRDVVGTNLGKPDAWKHIREDYAVRQVVFEAKNYSSIGREEFRQMSTYLVNQYGHLGFIVTRDEEENLKAGAELDWVREIYNSQKKLIIRISYKFFVHLLGKLRNPEKHDAVDKALRNLLDLYERRYLSLPSTRSNHGSNGKRKGSGK